MPRTILNRDLWRLAAHLEGRTYVEPPQGVVEHHTFSGMRDGCHRFLPGDGYVQCCEPVVEVLVPIYGADEPGWGLVPVCERHLREHMAEHLLGSL